MSISKDGEYVDVFEKTIKYKFHHKGRLATEFYHFEVENTGKYNIKFRNVQDLEMKESMLVSKRLFQNRLNSNEISIIVKETQNSLKKLAAIIFVVLGLNIAALGILFACNSQIF